MSVVFSVNDLDNDNDDVQLPNLSPDMCSVVRPADPHNVLQPGKGGRQGGSQVVALHIHHLLLAGQREPQHAKGGRSVRSVCPGITEFFNVGPQVGCGRRKAKDPDNLDVALVHLLIEKAIGVAGRAAHWLRLPPEANEPVELLLHDIAGQAGREGVLDDSASRGVVAVGQARLAPAHQVGHPDVPVVDESNDVGVVRTHGGIEPGTTCFRLDLVRE